MPRGTSRLDEAQLQGRLWTPQSFGQRLSFWFDPSFSASITQSGGTVSQFTDRTRGLALTQATSGSRPTYLAYGINARPALQFSGAQYMSASVSPGGTQHCLFVVATMSASAANDGRIISFGPGSVDFSSGGWNYSVYGSVTPHGLYNYKSGFSGQSVSVAAYDVPFVSTNTDDGVNADARMNGNPGTSSAISRTLVSTDIAIGANSAGGSPYTGIIGELFFLTGAYTPNEVQKGEGYLAWKWGTVGALAASHPYKNRPPTIGG